MSDAWYHSVDAPSSKSSFNTGVYETNRHQSLQQFPLSRLKAVASIVLTYLGALIVASLHHVFASVLDGKAVPSSADNESFIEGLRFTPTELSQVWLSLYCRKDLIGRQEWANRISTALAFLFKALLSASISSIFIAVAWQKLRSLPISIQAIDSLFGITSSPLQFRRLELWRKTFL